MATSAENYSPATTYDEALARAAAVWGVQAEYWDIFGNRHVTTPEVQSSILESLGFRSDSIDELNAAIRQRAELDWAVLAPACLVLSLSGGTLPVNIPDNLQAPQIEAEFVWESGRRDRITWRVDAVAAQIDGHQGHLGIQRKSFPLPPHAELGYHRLLLKAGPLSAECRLILCPDRAYQPTFLTRT